MENHYGIAVTNKYSLFLDDDCDPYEILKSTEEATLKSKTDKSKKDAKNEAKAAKSAKNKGPVKKPVTPIMDQPKGVDVNANKKEGEQKPRGRGKPTDGERTGSARPGGNREGFGNREFDRPPRRDRQMDRERGGERGGERGERPPTEFRERTDRPESGRGRGRGERGVGRGRGRGGRGGGGFGNKREFERHSGSDKTDFGSSGIKPVEKREGGGAHNWGTVKDDMEKEKASETLNESANDETVEAPEGNENQNPNAEPTEEETPAEEEGPKEMTLDEWRAQQTQDRAKATFNIRKPGEGVSGEQWKKTYVLKKKPEIKNESDEEESDEEEEEDPRHKKNLLNIEITFNDQPTRGRGGRRGRGGSERGDRGGGRGRGGDRGGRGGGGERGDRGDRAPGERRGGFGAPRGGSERGGRGGDRGGHRREAAPHIEDENDFPTLGAK